MKRRDAGTSKPSSKAELPPAQPESDLLQELEALRRLRPRQADAIELVGLQGKSTAAAAKALGVSVPTIERDLRAARAWLAARTARR